MISHLDSKNRKQHLFLFFFEIMYYLTIAYAGRNVL